MTKGYKMSVEPESMSSKYYDMSAKGEDAENGKYFKMNGSTEDKSDSKMKS